MLAELGGNQSGRWSALAAHAPTANSRSIGSREDRPAPPIACPWRQRYAQGAPGRPENEPDPRGVAAPGTTVYTAQGRRQKSKLRWAKRITGGPIE